LRGVSASPREGVRTASHPPREEELREAWDRGRDVVMRLWARGGKRPMAWWYLEAPVLGLAWPGADRQRSTLWRAPGVLGESERAEVEAEWRRDFDAAKGKGVRERREHYEFHDIPAELVEKWQAERRRHSRMTKAPDVASSVEGREEENTGTVQV